MTLTEWIVALTMNALEREYGVQELHDFGAPTVNEIARKIDGRLASVLSLPQAQ